MYVPLRSRTDGGSLQLAVAKPWQAVCGALKAGASAIGSCNYSLADAIDLAAAAKEACKHCGRPRGSHDPSGRLLVKGETCGGYEPALLKVIHGVDFWVNPAPADKARENRPCTRLTVLARTRDGWHALVSAVSAANHPDRFDDRPRISPQELASHAKDWLVLTGFAGSAAADAVWADPAKADAAGTLDQVRDTLRPDWRERMIGSVKELTDLFGRDNVLLDAQLFDVNRPVQTALTACLRRVSRETGLPCVATPDPHYVDVDDAADQRVVLACKLGVPLSQAPLAASREEGLLRFFRSSRYGIPSRADLEGVGHSNEELDRTAEVADRCESYGLDRPPILPGVECPNGMSPDEYVEKLCREGWVKAFGHVGKDHPRFREYGERARHELAVLKKAGLSSYFLIVRDYVNWARSQGMICGPRGSAAGSLVARLLDISRIDPVEWDLSFSRFYNSARNQPGRVSLPDIDVDFPKSGRARVFNYIRERYGADRVCQIATFGRMQARNALKGVLRSRGRFSQEEMNSITDLLPQGDAGVADELQEIREEEGSASLIEYAIDHVVGLKDYVRFGPDGELEGDLASEFAQAIRIEGVKVSMSRHAAGVIVTDRPVGELCPIVYDPATKSPICGWDMHGAEKAGLVKFDVLALADLDKLGAVRDLAATRRMPRVTY